MNMLKLSVVSSSFKCFAVCTNSEITADTFRRCLKVRFSSAAHTQMQMKVLVANDL